MLFYLHFIRRYEKGTLFGGEVNNYAIELFQISLVEWGELSEVFEKESVGMKRCYLLTRFGIGGEGSFSKYLGYDFEDEYLQVML